MLSIVDLTVKARNHVHFCRAGNTLRLDLVAHSANRLTVRSDKCDAEFGKLTCEFSILRQEAIAGMHLHIVG